MIRSKERGYNMLLNTFRILLKCHCLESLSRLHPAQHKPPSKRGQVLFFIGCQTIWVQILSLPHTRWENMGKLCYLTSLYLNFPFYKLENNTAYFLG